VALGGQLRRAFAFHEACTSAAARIIKETVLDILTLPDRSNQADGRAGRRVCRTSGGGRYPVKLAWLPHWD